LINFRRYKEKRVKKFPAAFILGLLISADCAYGDPQTLFPNSDGRGILAVSSDTFLTSLGVNTHVDQEYDPTSYIAPLRYLAVRNIRDSRRNRSGLIKLHEQTGVLVDLLGADVSGLMIAARSLAQANALLWIEGPNEPNNFPITYNGQNGGGVNGSWLQVALLQKDLYSQSHINLG
jgi:hypothetical protein